MKPEMCQWYTLNNELPVRFCADNPDFFHFVDQALGFFASGPREDSADLEVNVYFHKKNTGSLDTKMAHNVFSQKGQMLWKGRGCDIHITEGKPFRVNAYVAGDLLRDSFDLLRLGRRAAQQGAYLRLMRHAVYTPLLYLFQTKGYTLVHGSMVAKDDKAYLFVGGNYVGKTTTALELVLSHGFSLLSDNVIIVKDGMAYAFPDGIRVTDYSLDMLSIKEKKNAVADKYYVDLPTDRVAATARPVKTFFMQLGPHSEIYPIDKTAAFNRLNACHNYLQEFPEYSYTAFLPDFPSVTLLQERLRGFVGTQESFVFQSSQNRDKNIELLLAHLN